MNIAKMEKLKRKDLEELNELFGSCVNANGKLKSPLVSITVAGIQGDAIGLDAVVPEELISISEYGDKVGEIFVRVCFEKEDRDGSNIRNLCEIINIANRLLGLAFSVNNLEKEDYTAPTFLMPGFENNGLVQFNYLNELFEMRLYVRLKDFGRKKFELEANKL